MKKRGYFSNTLYNKLIISKIFDIFFTYLYPGCLLTKKDRIYGSKGSPVLICKERAAG